jgi:choline dehydrogenase-like flavoprotein
VQHQDGISPEWPLKYRDYQSYYDEASCFIKRMASAAPIRRSRRPASLIRSPPVSHEPRIQEIYDELAAGGYHPFPCPVGIKLNERCAGRANVFAATPATAFPCLVEAKSDADNNCIRPIFELPNVTLLTGAYVSKLTTNATGTEIAGVEVEFDGGQRKETYTAAIVVVACGAINSAALLLRSANSSHPTGLANSSDLVGRNFMFHKAAIVLSIGLKAESQQIHEDDCRERFLFRRKGFPVSHGRNSTGRLIQMGDDER